MQACPPHGRRSLPPYRPLRYEIGFHVVIAEECVYDRGLLSHKVNLFDMHHKYADVMHLDELA